MILRFSILVCLLSLYITPSYAIKYPGKLVKPDGDTIYCLIKFNEMDHYRVAGQILSTTYLRIIEDGKKRTVRTENLRCYCIEYEGEWQTYWKIDYDNQHYMMRKMVEGPMTYYFCFYMRLVGPQVHSLYLFDNTKFGKQLYLDNPWDGSKRKKLAEFMKECPTLSKKILDKEIKRNEEIAEYYNTKCL